MKPQNLDVDIGCGVRRHNKTIIASFSINAYTTAMLASTTDSVTPERQH